MNIAQLQERLTERGCEPGPVDGVMGTQTKAALLQAFTNLEAPRLTDTDFEQAAEQLNAPVATIRAICKVESNGAGFKDGRPVILYEPHIFGRRTAGRYNSTRPDISSARWNRALYAKSQLGRYRQLIDAVALDVDAGFCAASYGLFQILGANWQVCEYPSPFAMAMAMAQSEGDQLEGLVRFVIGNGLTGHLRRCSADADACRPFVRAYNGSGYEANAYHLRLAREIGAAA